MRLVEIHGGAGWASVGSRTVVVEPCAPGWRVGPDGPVVASISFAQRSTLLREAVLAGDAPADVAHAVARAAGAPRDAADDPVVQSIALHLAGAGDGGLRFAEVWSAVVGHLGGNPAVVASMAAADADALAEAMVDRAAPDGDGSWTTLLLDDVAPTAEPAADDRQPPEAVAVALAIDLLDRGRPRPVRDRPERLPLDGEVAPVDPSAVPEPSPWSRPPAPIGAVAPSAVRAASPRHVEAMTGPVDRWGVVAADAAGPLPGVGPVPAARSASSSSTSAAASRSSQPSPPEPGIPMLPPWPGGGQASAPAPIWGPRATWRGLGREPFAQVGAVGAIDGGRAIDATGDAPVAPTSVWDAPGAGPRATAAWPHEVGSALTRRAALGSLDEPAADGALAELAARLHHLADLRGVAR